MLAELGETDFFIAQITLAGKRFGHVSPHKLDDLPIISKLAPHLSGCCFAFVRLV